MTDDSISRVSAGFWKKLRAAYPGHPWLATPQAKAALGRQDAMVWQEPRRVEEWWWMDVEWEEDGRMIRYGRVQWNQDGTGHYSVSITYQREHGLGLYLWPQFYALADAQEFVEQLMLMSPDEAKQAHGAHWIGVVL